MASTVCECKEFLKRRLHIGIVACPDPDAEMKGQDDVLVDGSQAPAAATTTDATAAPCAEVAGTEAIVGAGACSSAAECGSTTKEAADCLGFCGGRIAKA